MTQWEPQAGSGGLVGRKSVGPRLAALVCLRPMPVFLRLMDDNLDEIGHASIITE